MNANILIIDDERSICESLKFAFSTEYNVRITTDPHEGLSLLRENDFDVVLLWMASTFSEQSTKSEFLPRSSL